MKSRKIVKLSLWNLRRPNFKRDNFPLFKNLLFHKSLQYEFIQSFIRSQYALKRDYITEICQRHFRNLKIALILQCYALLHKIIYFIDDDLCNAIFAFNIFSFVFQKC